MAKKGNERLKQALLLGFVVVSFLLVGAIWAEALTPDDAAAPGYYRGAPPVTYEPPTPDPNTTPTESEHEHEGRGRGEHGTQENGPTPTPYIFESLDGDDV